VKEIDRQVSLIARSAKRSVLFSHFIDTIKYGLSAAFFIVPVFLLFRWLLGLLGVVI